MVAASTAVTAFGQVQAGRAAQASANYNAEVQRNNAIIARNQAGQEEERARLDITRRQREQAQIQGRQRALAGASGVEIASGSPLAVLVGTAEQGALDVAIIRSNADQRIQDLRFQGANLDAQSVLTRSDGRSARSQSLLQAGGTLLSGASRASGLWQNRGN